MKRGGPIRYKRPRLDSRRDLKSRLDSLDARIVKIRDGHQCQQCAADGVRTVGILDCGHLYPKGKYPAVRYDLENKHGQCRRHNQIHCYRPEFYFLWFQKAHGEERLHALHERAVSGKALTDEQMEVLITERTAMLAEMESFADSLV